MTDFFADLEHQLVQATIQRPARLRRARVRRMAATVTAATAAVALAGGLAAALTTGGDTTSHTPAASPPPPTTTTPPRSTPTTDFRVAILNGTARPGDAGTLAMALADRGFTVGTVANGPTQNVSHTGIYYSRGRLADAIQVSKVVVTGADFSLKPITPAQRRIAGDDASVVIVTGADAHALRGP